MGTLAFERVAIATGRVNTTKAVADIIADVRSMTDAEGRPLGAEPEVRQQVADLWARALIHRTISHRVITGAAAGAPPGPVTSIGKLYFCPLVEDLADFRLSLAPLGGQFDLAEEDDELAATRSWLRLANQSRGTAIAGGSTYIQRNIAAERILGMPRG
jgi:alkylation response protein AidB-like acyl-CoA dehydrogenase